jgi:hypothetical protein
LSVWGRVSGVDGEDVVAVGESVLRCVVFGGTVITSW